MDLHAYFDKLETANNGISKKHGFSKSKDFEKRSLYRCFMNILSRCNNTKHPRYYDYGGRGIECHFENFEAFAREAGFRPSPDHSIDRIDNEGNYEPGNIRWATATQQIKNRRPYRRRAKPIVTNPTLH